MKSQLTVTEEAVSLQLLSINEMRVAAGLEASDSTQDAVLTARGLAIAADIMSECNIAAGAGGEPTLLLETLTETFYHVDSRSLLLARRHNVVVHSITVDGSEVVESAFMVDTEAGIIKRVPGTGYGRWCGSKIVVVYDAGFEEIPGGLKQEALDRLTSLTSQSDRDPYVKSESDEVTGVGSHRVDYWAGDLPSSSNSSPSLSPALKRFFNAVFA